MVGDGVETPMLMLKVSMSSSDDQLDARELAISELFSAPCVEAPSEPELEAPAEFLDRIAPIKIARDPSSGVDDLDDPAAVIDILPSSHAKRSEMVDDAPTLEHPESATSIMDAVCRVAGSTFVSSPAESQDHTQEVSEESVPDPADDRFSENTLSTWDTSIPVEDDISTPSRLLSLTVEDGNTLHVDGSMRKGKQRAKDDENAELQQPKKRRRRPATTVLSESLVMNSRSTSPALSDASSLSPLSEDEVVSRGCQPTKKRRRTEGGSKTGLTGATTDAHRSESNMIPTQTVQVEEAESQPSTSTDQPTLASSAIDASVKAEMRGFLIQAMGLSRASSMPASSLLREVLREQPQLAHQRAKDEWLSLIEDTLANAPGCEVFGRIDRIGTDAADNPLEAQWFYIPEKDEDQDRAVLLREMMPKKRTATKSHKQYYYRPLGKMSRWDAEEDA